MLTASPTDIGTNSEKALDPEGTIMSEPPGTMFPVALANDQKLWPEAKMKEQKFPCAHCGAVHSWAKSDTVLGRLVA
jgi:hypothetical protein